MLHQMILKDFPIVMCIFHRLPPMQLTKPMHIPMLSGIEVKEKSQSRSSNQYLFPKLVNQKKNHILYVLEPI